MRNKKWRLLRIASWAHNAKWEEDENMSLVEQIAEAAVGGDGR